MHSIFENYQQHLQKKYFKNSPLPAERLSENLISPFKLTLPRDILEQAENIAVDLQKLSRSEYYQMKIQDELPFELDSVQKTPSLFSSLDVHVNQHGRLKLIEVNTNASSYMMNAENYEQQNIATFPNALQSLKTAFQKTYGTALKAGNLFLIIDENPLAQNLYIEFLIFQKWVTATFDMDCEIADPKDLSLGPNKELLFQSRPVAAIYNRTTDFYFKDYPQLAEAYKNSATPLSPNPRGYGLLADKKRLLNWNASLFFDLQKNEGLELPHLQNALLETRQFSDFASPDELWAERAQYFFKPPNSYGGKAVYKGKSISRTVFERIYQDDYLAQELVPPLEVTLPFNGQNHTFKYDLRFYMFEGEVQLAAARLYQGQLTNLKTPLGGLTPIEFAP